MASKRKRVGSTAGIEVPVTLSNKRRCLIESLCPTSADDFEILDIVDARCDIQPLSVISSTKIRKRVSAVLRHLALAPPDTPIREETSSTAEPKSKVSLLRAKACDVGKLVSIAEIAKREIERDVWVRGEGQDGEDTGRWFQYIALGEDILRVDRDDGQAAVQDTLLRDHDTDEEFKGNGQFELMKTPFERAVEGKPALRGVPVMCLFLSTSSIEELKRCYGEQTNTRPTHTAV
ncbi:hypothetical protein GGS20DRAFT_585950 [Poronia punctata]|nr:hypothetical protein GGS20DRAFT_585950 [Poronia punctata]